MHYLHGAGEDASPREGQPSYLTCKVEEQVHRAPAPAALWVWKPIFAENDLPDM